MVERPKVLPVNRFGQQPRSGGFGRYLGGIAAALVGAALAATPATVITPEDVAPKLKSGKHAVRHVRGSALGRNGVGSQPVPGGGNRERQRNLARIAAGLIKVDADAEG